MFSRHVCPMSNIPSASGVPSSPVLSGVLRSVNVRVSSVGLAVGLGRKLPPPVDVQSIAGPLLIPKTFSVTTADGSKGRRGVILCW